MNLLAKRMSAVSASATVALAQRARELREAGRSVIDLVEGESDQPTPAHVIDEAFRAAHSGATRYTAVGGTPAMKAAIRSKFERENGLVFSDQEVMASTGAKQVIFNALLATLDAGDEVIIPAPYWVSYPDMVRLCGGVPVIVACDPKSAYRLDPAQLEQAITPRAKWLILNSPNNPSGAIYTHDELALLMDVVRRHPGLMVMSDDIYEHLRFDGRKFTTPLQVAPDLRPRLLTINGTSKSYAMTGWRIGYGAGPAELISAMNVLQGQSTTNPSAVGQAAAIAAMEGSQEFITSHCQLLAARRSTILASLAGCAGLDCLVPEGAFYVYPSVSGLLGQTTGAGKTLRSDVDVAEHFITLAGVASVPGTAFGMPGHLRLFFARPEPLLRDAGTRIVQAIRDLKG